MGRVRPAFLPLWCELFLPHCFVEPADNMCENEHSAWPVRDHTATLWTCEYRAGEVIGCSEGIMNSRREASNLRVRCETWGCIDVVVWVCINPVDLNGIEPVLKAGLTDNMVTFD